MGVLDGRKEGGEEGRGQVIDPFTRLLLLLRRREGEIVAVYGVSLPSLLLHFFALSRET